MTDRAAANLHFFLTLFVLVCLGYAVASVQHSVDEARAEMRAIGLASIETSENTLKTAQMVHAAKWQIERAMSIRTAPESDDHVSRCNVVYAIADPRVRRMARALWQIDDRAETVFLVGLDRDGNQVIDEAESADADAALSGCVRYFLDGAPPIPVPDEFQPHEPKR